MAMLRAVLARLLVTVASELNERTFPAFPKSFYCYYCAYETLRIVVSLAE